MIERNSRVDSLFNDFETAIEENMSPVDRISVPRKNKRLFFYKDLLPNPNQERTFDMKDIRSKADSIERNGLLQDLLVELIPGSRQAYIIAGHKRHAAISYLIKEKNRHDLEYIWCNIMQADGLNNELAMIETNLEASELSNYERMMAYGRKEEILKEKGTKGTMRDVLAGQSNINATMIGYYLKLYKKLHLRCKILLREEKLTVKQALKLADMTGNDQERIAISMEKGLAYDQAVKNIDEEYLMAPNEEQKEIIMKVVSQHIVPHAKITAKQLQEAMGAKNHCGYSNDSGIGFVNATPEYLSIEALGPKKRMNWPTVADAVKETVDTGFKKNQIFIKDVADHMTSRLNTKVEIKSSQIRINYTNTDDLNRLLDLLGMIESEE